MIEDALKSTRNLHRLIIAVSLITIVFSLSLQIDPQRQQRKDAIDTLLEQDFLAYEAWLARKVQSAVDKVLPEAVAPVRSVLEDDRILVFQTDDIADALTKPIHVGKLLTRDLVVSDLPAATLADLDRLDVLEVSRDVQITIPELKPLAPALKAFFEAHPDAGKRVSEVQVTSSVSDLNVTGESFVTGDSLSGGLYFELVDAVTFSGAPVFQGMFDARVVEVPDTAFTTWLKTLNLPNIVRVDGEQIVFLPSLGELPRGFREEKLGVLSARLAAEIAASGPEQQTATILGTEVPGLLVVYAAPLVLMALVYYFMWHVFHLLKLAPSHAKEIGDFAWLPITMPSIRFPKTDQNVPLFLIEYLFSSLALPVFAIAVLYAKITEFGAISAFTISLLAVSVAWIAVHSGIGLRRIQRLRHAVITEQAQPPDPGPSDQLT